MNLRDVLKKMEAAEREFVSRPVLAPVLNGRAVSVRIAGVACQLKVDNAPQGWAVLQPESSSRAKFVRAATRVEIERYLALLPSVRLIAVARVAQGWLSLPAHYSEARFALRGAVNVLMPGENVQPFDTLITRFDGANFWFQSRDSRRPPAIAAYLRDALSAQVKPAELSKPQLSSKEREAYDWVWKRLKDAEKRTVEGKLSDALAHADGRLTGFIERDDSYTVTYRVGSRQHVSTVSKRDLTVITSGICLSDRDDDFDLTSLVGVMREAAGLDDFLD